MSSNGPRVGLWGRFDVAAFAAIALPAIYEREIRRRLPAASVEPYAPLGERRPGFLDGGFAALDLGESTPRRAAELADALDCAIVVGDAIEAPDDALGSDAAVRGARFFIEGLGGALEERCPVVWSAVGVPHELDRAGVERVRRAAAGRPDVSVRDEVSRERLRRAGAAAGLPVLPDPLRLLPRVFSADHRSRRLEYLRHMEWFPHGSAPLVLQGGRSLAGSAEAIASEVEDALAGTEVPLVLIELDPGRGDGDFLDALEPFLKVARFRLPREATLADLVTVLSTARAFVGASDRGATAAAAFGAPAATLAEHAPGGKGRRGAGIDVAGLSAAIRSLLRPATARAREAPPEDALDAHFDRLAEIAETSFLRRLRAAGDPVPALVRRLREAERRLEELRAAHSARTRQVVEERVRLAGTIEERLAEVQRDAVAGDLATERLAREAVEAQLESATTELTRRRADEKRLESGLERSREEIEELRKAFDAARRDAADAERRSRRAEKAAAELRADLERAASRLERARSDHADVRVSQTVLFAELAEARSEASRLAHMRRTREEGLARAESERDLARGEAASLAAQVERLATELESLRVPSGRSALRGVRGGRA